MAMVLFRDNEKGAAVFVVSCLSPSFPLTAYE